MTTAGQIIQSLARDFNTNEFVTPEDVLKSFDFGDMTTEECWTGAYVLLSAVAHDDTHPDQARAEARDAIHAMGCHV